MPLTSASTRWMCSFRLSFIVCCSLTATFISLRQLPISAVCFDRAWSQRTIRLRKSCKLVTWWTSILPTAEFVPITAMSLLRISSSRVFTETNLKKKIKIYLPFVLYSIFTSFASLSFFGIAELYLKLLIHKVVFSYKSFYVPYWTDLYDFITITRIAYFKLNLQKYPCSGERQLPWCNWCGFEVDVWYFPPVCHSVPDWGFRWSPRGYRRPSV